MTQNQFEFGVYTFGELLSNPISGKKITAEQRITTIIETAKFADDMGLDVFGLGEHHRLDFAVSSTAVVLAAIAQVTKNIRLTSATTVLSTADPVRVFEDFSTLDLISQGRAEIIAGRGAFVESFPLFGFNLANYNALFDEKLHLLQQLNSHERITWQGKFRSSLHNNDIAPRPKQSKLPIWRGVGGTPESAAQSGTDGIGMALSILAGDPKYAQPLVNVYRQAGNLAGYTMDELPIAITSHGYISHSATQAVDEFYPYYAHYIEKMMNSTIHKDQLIRSTAPNNALAVGGPEEIIEKILYTHQLFRHNRFLLQLDIGQPIEHIKTAIELLATKVMPFVRQKLANK